jgi:hypothetical protein
LLPEVAHAIEPALDRFQIELGGIEPGIHLAPVERRLDKGARHRA